jgi:hypothetical protein
MTWLYHPLLLLIARSTDSQLAKQVEFLKAENQMLRRRLTKRTQDGWAWRFPSVLAGRIWPRGGWLNAR